MDRWSQSPFGAVFPRISPMIMTLSPHSLLLDGCPVHLWTALGLSMSSFCHAQHSSPRHWPSTATVNDNGAAGKSSSPNIREETHRGIRLDWVSAFLRKKHTRLQLFWVTIKLSVNICFQKLRPPWIFFCPPWWCSLATGLLPYYKFRFKRRKYNEMIRNNINVMKFRLIRIRRNTFILCFEQRFIFILLYSSIISAQGPVRSETVDNGKG